MTAREEIRKFYFEDLRWCDCGEPHEALRLMQRVLALLHALPIDGDFKESHDTIKEALDFAGHRGLYWSYLYTLAAAGLIDHGGNVFCSWLTEKGLTILAALECSNLDTVLDEQMDELDR
jgi:hypothetical protein